MKRIAITATILVLNLASMSAAAQDKPIGLQGAAGLVRVTEREPEADLDVQAELGDEALEVMLSDDLAMEDVRLDPELLKALADLERNRQLLEDPIFETDYTRTHFASTSYSSGAGGRFALRLIPLGIGLIVLIVRATRRAD